MYDLPPKIVGALPFMDDESAGRLAKMIASYYNGMSLPDFGPELNGLFESIRQELDASMKASEAHREAGKKGGRPKSERSVTRQKEPAAISEPQQKPVRFTPPTVEEVAAYCRERGNTISAETFVDHYTANGWRQGKGTGRPIKDWKACVRTWENSRKAAPQIGPNGVAIKPESEQLHDLDDLF